MSFPYQNLPGYYVPGYHIPGTNMPIGAVAGQQPIPYVAPRRESFDEQAKREARAIARWNEELATFRANKQVELSAITDPIERLLRAAIACCDLAGQILPQEKGGGWSLEVTWDREKLTRYFADLAVDLHSTPPHGMGPWNEDQVTDWFLSHVQTPPTDMIEIVTRKRILGHRRTTIAGWSLRPDPDGRELVAVSRYPRFFVTASGRVGYQEQSRPLSTMDEDRPALGSLALQDMARLCGISDEINEPDSPIESKKPFFRESLER